MSRSLLASRELAISPEIICPLDELKDRQAQGWLDLAASADL